MFKAVSRPLPNLKDWRFFIDQWGIAWAEFDREGESQNSLGRRPLEELAEIVAEVEKGARDKSIRGLVITSAKERGFVVGADIREFAGLTTESDVIEILRPVTALFDRIERLPVPVVCAINGFCLGGGLELALACHYRIATRDPSTKLGFPEVKLGIFPGFNGTARSIRQAGAPAAMQAMLTGKMLSASAARGSGLLDQLVDSRGALPWAARKAVLRNRKSKPASFAKQLLTKWPARDLLAKRMRAEVAKKAREDHYPAPYRLIDLFERYGGNDEAMKAAETRAFAPLMVSDQSRNLRRVFWLSELLKGQAPKKLNWRPSRIHVIGAGTMGADIAGWCVARGMEVTLQDVSADQIAKGIAAQGKLFARKFKTKAQRDAAKARLIADPSGEGIPRADVVIEAIVEKLDVKQKVLGEVEGKMKPGAVLATNTSSLLIEDIASGLPDPGRLIGLHFFNPVALMPLVEVVRGAQTREDDVKRGAAFVAAIDKFPLITKSVPGFLVNRVLTPYMFGAMLRLEHGEDKERIDEAARSFGMPMGPIELADTVGLDVCAHVAHILKYSSEGSKLDRLVAEGKLGKKTGEGFYVWKDGKPEKTGRTFDKAEMEKLGRDLVEPLIAEAQKCVDAGIVENADLVDAGVIFGTGFAPFRGGPLHYKAAQAPKPAAQAAAAE
ncbi:MAG: enoyl-CoA hydratase/isomerase family protein [Hyphomicrobium sp.]|uniref:3-hydroxyacyl-CoA dehydrogenase NAD-binding domain-containing protein n=1 Tax=Hyphomicrobium sp. TaxID=82 RepID=UPI001322D6DE|nr:3-hydroxyacyl-CoA dehydrogenase NAD-binding domain-containing protein [Hyphomicrobium sp.]KAB2940788.1 MAG: 3-hydroxyacyl-CoA dehydrogenase [Hyphomicrobium sp.]MBZ0211361.1 enoyl-CoA hydratase/isomerase family protein [Hyphomicrobium sp.]MCZ7595384.1 3-hydroxyacyl-CoA dehydrogenase NAD-binding domain-containing protein [Hyphomicrobium sp.]